MKKRIKKLLSNIFLRIAIIFLFITMLFAICCFGLHFLYSKIPIDSISSLIDIFVILVMISATLCCFFIIVMMISIVIYGNEVKHDKSYWRNFSSTGKTMPTERKTDPYMLDMRHKNPILGFITGIFVFLSIPTIVLSKYTNFTSFGIKQIAVLIPIIYALVIAMVFLIRLYRRFRAFHVKIYKKLPEGK